MSNADPDDPFASPPSGAADGPRLISSRPTSSRLPDGQIPSNEMEDAFHAQKKAWIEDYTRRGRLTPYACGLASELGDRACSYVIYKAETADTLNSHLMEIEKYIERVRDALDWASVPDKIKDATTIGTYDNYWGKLNVKALFRCARSDISYTKVNKYRMVVHTYIANLWMQPSNTLEFTLLDGLLVGDILNTYRITTPKAFVYGYLWELLFYVAFFGFVMPGSASLIISYIYQLSPLLVFMAALNFCLLFGLIPMMVVRYFLPGYGAFRDDSSYRELAGAKSMCAVYEEWRKSQDINVLKKKIKESEGSGANWSDDLTDCITELEGRRHRSTA